MHRGAWSISVRALDCFEYAADLRASSLMSLLQMYLVLCAFILSFHLRNLSEKVFHCVYFVHLNFNNLSGKSIF